MIALEGRISDNLVGGLRRGGVTECPLRYKYVGGWTKSANQSAEQLDLQLGLLRYTRRWGSERTGLSSLHYSSVKGPKRLQSITAHG